MRWPAFFVLAHLVLAFAALLAAGVSTQRFTLILRPVVLEIVIRALSTYLPRCSAARARRLASIMHGLDVVRRCSGRR